MLIISVGLLFAAAAGLSHRNARHIRPHHLCALLKPRFLEKEAELDSYAEALMDKQVNSIHPLLAFCEKKQIEPTEFAFYIYQRDTLRAWSSNVVNLPTKREKKLLNLSGYQTLDNSRVDIRQYHNGDRTLYGIYVLESPYLPAGSFCDVGMPNNGNFHTQPPATGPMPVYDRNHQAAFSLEMNRNIRESDLMALWEALLWMLACTLLGRLTYQLLKKRAFFRRRPQRLTLLLMLMAAGMLLLILLGRRPASMFTANLFSGRYYSSIFHSLGGLFMGSYTLLVMAILIVKTSVRMERPGHPARAWLLLTLSHLLYIATYIGFYRMILSSSTNILPYITARSFPLSTESPLLLKLLFATSLCMILCATLLLVERCYRIFFRNPLPRRRKILLGLLSALLVWAGYLAVVMRFPQLSQHRIWISGSLIYWIIVGINIIHALLPETRFSIRYHTVSCLFSILLLSLLLADTNYERLQLSKESFANSLLDKENPLMQYNLREISNLLEEDDSLQLMFPDTNIQRNDVIAYIQEQYLQPYFANDRKHIFVGRTSIPTDRTAIHRYNETFAAAKADRQCASLRMVNAHRIDNYKYLLLKFFNSTNKSGNPDTVCIAIETMAGSDYFKPDFLLNRNEHRLENEIQQLSCAEYDNGRLSACIDLNNVFHTSMRCYGLDTLYNGMHFSYRNNDYYLYFHQPSHLVLLATGQTMLRKCMATFPYLILLALLLNTVIYIIVNYRSQHRFLLFKQRIRLFIVIMIILTAIVGGIMFAIFVQKFSQDELYQTSLVRSDMIMRLLPAGNLSKENATTFNMEQQLLPAIARMPKEYLENTNFYTLDGEAVFMLDKNLPIPQSPNRLNPEVIERIRNRQETFYRDTKISRTLIHANILYKPFLNDKGEMVGYLSFPSRQKGGYLEHLFSYVLPTFLSIYLLLTLLFVLFGTLIGNYLLASLTHIADSMSRVKLQSKNKKIRWKYDDEIGMLVKDYNRLVDDLEVSAEMLARSERESSWKELAQQVAHEIKNPLTPMKLSTQQLQRCIREGTLTDEKLEKYTRMMVEQINALTEIASSFSSMAKIRQGDGNREDLLEIMNNAVNMYAQRKDVVLEIKHQPQLTEAAVWIEKEQLLRVFNNLIKNAIQAKKPGIQQHIELILDDENDTQWLVTVTDYGKGMDEEEKRHAFTPHFTTKSAGSGLGLAIVRNILSDWGGSIRFESVKNDHTSFFILLPKHQPAE
ncbi:MAG: GHKL domain-containing protein [Bacteroidales bacterium]|nr:GHKL domain-containing protein [Bacteroidales bacterium]